MPKKKHTRKTRLLMSQIAKQNGRGKYNKGRKHSEETKRKISEKNLNKEGIITPSRAHQRIAALLGKPKYCEVCKRSDKEKYEWANKDHKYNLDPKYWMRLCRKCHADYDRKYNGRFVYKSTRNET